MKAVEDYIKKYTRNYSNEILVNGDESYTNIPSKGEYHPWLTPDHARSVAEIAREEITERALIAFQVVCNRPAKLFPNCEAYCNACKQFKQAIKDE